MREATAVGDCGQEWLVEAYGCDADALADLSKLKSLFADLMRGCRFERSANQCGISFLTREA